MAPENSQNAYQMEGLSRNWALFIRNPIGKTGVILLIIFGLMAVGSFLPPQIDTMYHPMTGVDPLIANSSPPSWKHWLGTDYMGRDLFSQLLTGARIAFIVGITSAFISIVFGTIIGMLAGYGGKILDSVLMRLADMIMVIGGVASFLIVGAIEYLGNRPLDRAVSLAGSRQGYPVTDTFPQGKTIYRSR